MIPFMGLHVDEDAQARGGATHLLSVTSPMFPKDPNHSVFDPMHDLITQHSPPRDSNLSSAFEQALTLDSVSLSADELLLRLRADEKARREQESRCVSDVMVETTWHDFDDLDTVQAAREMAIKEREKRLQQGPEIAVSKPAATTPAVVVDMNAGKVVGRVLVSAPELEIDSDDSDFGEQVRQQRTTPSATRQPEPAASSRVLRPQPVPAPQPAEVPVAPMSLRAVSMTPVARSLLEHADADWDSDLGVFDALGPIAEQDSDDCDGSDDDDEFRVPAAHTLAAAHAMTTPPHKAASPATLSRGGVPPPPSAPPAPSPASSASSSFSTSSTRPPKPLAALPPPPSRELPPPPPPPTHFCPSASASASSASSASSHSLVRPSMALPPPPMHTSASGPAVPLARGSVAFLASTFAQRQSLSAPAHPPAPPARSPNTSVDQTPLNKRGSVSALAAMFAQRQQGNVPHASRGSATMPAPPSRVAAANASDSDDDTPYVIAPALLGKPAAPVPAPAPAGRANATAQVPPPSTPVRLAPTPLQPLKSQPATPLLTPVAFEPVPVVAVAPVAPQPSLLAKELSDSGVLRVLRRPEKTRVGGTGTMTRATVWFPDGESLALSVWSDMTVQDVLVLALELHADAHKEQPLPMDTALYELRMYDEEEGEADSDMPPLQRTAVFSKLAVEHVAVVPLSVSDDEDEECGVADYGPSGYVSPRVAHHGTPSTGLAGLSRLATDTEQEYDSDFGEFASTAPTPRSLVSPSQPSRAYSTTIAPSARAQLPAAPVAAAVEYEYEDADDYMGLRASQVAQVPLPTVTPTTHEEMEFLVHAMYARLRPETVSQYTEWRVIKTNSKGKRQERYMGLDRHNIYNRTQPREKEKHSLFGKLGVSRESRPVLSISHCAVDKDSLLCFSISYKNDDRVDTRLYEVLTAQECADIVARIRYLINNP